MSKTIRLVYVDGPALALYLSPVRTQASFTATISALMPALARAALSLTKDPTKADDLVQDTLVRAWRHRETFIEGSAPKAWLLTILRNTFINEWHRDARRAAVLVTGADFDAALYYAATPEATPDDALDTAARASSVRGALSLVPDSYRAATVLATEGMPYSEIAEELDIPVGTVMSRVHRGRSFVRSQLVGVGVAA